MIDRHAFGNGRFDYESSGSFGSLIDVSPISTGIRRRCLTPRVQPNPSSEFKGIKQGSGSAEIRSMIQGEILVHIARVTARYSDTIFQGTAISYVPVDGRDAAVH